MAAQRDLALVAENRRITCTVVNRPAHVSVMLVGERLAERRIGAREAHPERRRMQGLPERLNFVVQLHVIQKIRAQACSLKGARLTLDFTTGGL